MQQRDHHKVLVHHTSITPALFFLGLILGVIIHINYPMELLERWEPAVALGALMIVLSTFWVLWALRHSRELYHPHTDKTCYVFYRGPYKASRHPVYVGLLVMILGLGLAINTVWLFIIGFILVLLFTFVIIPHEEKLLLHDAGECYREYVQKVRMWL